jgi:hypothetical protein
MAIPLSCKDEIFSMRSALCTELLLDSHFYPGMLFSRTIAGDRFDKCPSWSSWYQFIFHANKSIAHSSGKVGGTPWNAPASNCALR